MSLFLGLPQWSHPAWPGHLLGVGAKPAEHLAHYARVFNTVEGNTTFYASPTPDTVRRWADAVPAHFRFSFKFPQTISHQSDLVSADKQVSDFIRLLEPLHDKLGLLKLQLPARFGPQGLPRLAAFFERLPPAFPYALEVRHPDFFAKGEAERQLNRLLMDKGINRIMLDSRPLFSVPATTAAMIDAQARSRGCRCTCWPPPMLPWCGSSACRIRPPTTPSCQAGCRTGASGWRRAKISTSLYIRPTTPSPPSWPVRLPACWGRRWPLGRGKTIARSRACCPFSQPPHPVFPAAKKSRFFVAGRGLASRQTPTFPLH